MVHTLGGLGHPEITRGSLIPTLWVSHRSFGDMGGGKTREKEKYKVAEIITVLERRTVECVWSMSSLLGVW